MSQQQQQSTMKKGLAPSPKKVPGISGTLPKGFTKGLPSAPKRSSKMPMKKKSMKMKTTTPSFSKVQKSVKKTMGY